MRTVKFGAVPSPRPWVPEVGCGGEKERDLEYQLTGDKLTDFVGATGDHLALAVPGHALLELGFSVQRESTEAEAPLVCAVRVHLNRKGRTRFRSIKSNKVPLPRCHLPTPSHIRLPSLVGLEVGIFIHLLTGLERMPNRIRCRGGTS